MAHYRAEGLREFTEIPAPGPRRVVVAAVHSQPSKSRSAEENVRRFLEVVDKAVPEKTDVILLPEGITVVGTGKKYADVAEPAPGPTTALLAEAARKKRAYIVAGIYEREGQLLYNTAVLVDRDGNLADKYRKVYLPREEMEGGLTPGDDYPVFATDFGRVQLMICWDVQYADPARALALEGAELVLVPIWGGNETLGTARAIENHVFIATCGYDYPTYVMDSAGKVLAQAAGQGTAAVATIDLNRRYVDPWLGHMRGRFFEELRLDVPVGPPRSYWVE
ncbi:MAG: carbon-nitrogen hydrolase family protein [Bryobacteraceae bacterium]|nr:carbon-nitrogen hydrolase family protein [Bryobacteraceae bacterium]